MIINQIALSNRYNINELQCKRKFLAFVNPIGGKGKALKVFNNIKNFFDMSSIEIVLVKTNYYKHAYEYTKSANLQEVNKYLKLVQWNNMY